MTLYSYDGHSPQVPADGDYWVAPGAHVIGQVRLEEGSSVWFGSTLRGDNEPIEVGPGTNIQENCVLHTDPGFPLTIERDVTVGHMAMLHGCSVGEGTLIGMGAKVLNGAKVGRNCLIGAGALVTEGKEIPDGSVVMGAPGRVVREVTEADIASIRNGVEVYKKKQRRYRNELKAL